MFSIKRKIVQGWYEGHILLYFLLPLSWIFLCVVYLRKIAYQWGIVKIYHASLPVIVVGNITVGGTGKTPLIIALYRALKEKGYRIGIVSRGYGGKSSQVPCWVDQNAAADIVGDEALLLARETKGPVVICAKRKLAVQMLEDSNCVDIILSDDGLQHYAMGRDIEIAMIDSQRRLGNGWCLPAGPLREPAARLTEVHCIIEKGEQYQENPPMYVLEPKALTSVINSEKILPLEHLKGKTIHAVAAIGHPEPFFQLLEHLAAQVIIHTFPDHHFFAKDEITFDDEHWVIMTAKDAVKCQDIVDEKYWYVSTAAQVPNSCLDIIMAKLEERKDG